MFRFITISWVCALIIRPLLPFHRWGNWVSCMDGWTPELPSVTEYVLLSGSKSPNTRPAYPGHLPMAPGLFHLYRALLCQHGHTEWRSTTCKKTQVTGKSCSISLTPLSPPLLPLPSFFSEGIGFPTCSFHIQSQNSGSHQPEGSWVEWTDLLPCWRRDFALSWDMLPKDTLW